MAAKLARKAQTTDPGTEAPPAPLLAARRVPGGSLDPLILALARAVDRQAPAQPPGPQNAQAD